MVIIDVEDYSRRRRAEVAEVAELIVRRLVYPCPLCSESGEVVLHPEGGRSLVCIEAALGAIAGGFDPDASDCADPLSVGRNEI